MPTRSIFDCHSPICDYVFEHSDCCCIPGSIGDCFNAEFAVARKSPFHSQDLIEATAELKNAIKNIFNKSDWRKKLREGRKLAFIKTPDGLLLVWVKRCKLINAHSKPRDIRKALKLKG
jgi:hypothetical protein